MTAFQDDTTPLQIACTIDCVDLERVANFWSELLGVEILGIEEPFAFLAAAPDRKVALWIQRVPEPKQGKSRAHLDFAVRDLEATEERIVELGGSLGERQSFHNFNWRICFDPEGTEFDVMQATQD